MKKNNTAAVRPTYQRFYVTQELRRAIAAYPAKLMDIAEKTGVNYKRLSQILNNSVLVTKDDTTVQAVADYIKFKGEILRPLPD